MSDTAFSCRLRRLIQDVMHHPYKEELLNLMEEQLCDDTYELFSEPS